LIDSLPALTHYICVPRYPPGFTEFVQSLKVLSLDLFRAINLDCVVQTTFYGKFTATMCVPVIMVGIILLNGKRNGTPVADLLTPITLVLFLLYPSISGKTFEMFACRDLGPSLDGAKNIRFHDQDYSIDCDSLEYAFYYTLALAMVMAYPIGIPLAFGLAMWCKKKLLRVHIKIESPESDSATEMDEETLYFRTGLGEWQNSNGQEDFIVEVETTQHQFDFLVGSYEPHIFWWELVEYLRKFLLTGALIAVEPKSASQIFVGILISFFYFSVVCSKGPYKDDSADVLKMLSETQLFITLLCSLMLLPTLDLTGEYIGKNTVDNLLLVANVIAMPVILCLILRKHFNRKRSKAEKLMLRHAAQAVRKQSREAYVKARKETSVETSVELAEFDNPLRSDGAASPSLESDGDEDSKKKKKKKKVGPNKI